MPTIKLTAPLYDSVRVRKTAKAFDCDPKIYCQRDITYQVPPMDSDWQIGLIVGPSGAGKTTVAKELLGNSLYTGNDWDNSKALVDNFPDGVESEQIHFLFTAVGFSSIPAWIKPYNVLSNGEKFRADLALALSRGKENDIVVFDEYTSVVDRTVAKTASMALNKNIKNGRIKRRFVAVTCHYDLIEWLQPDWILDMESGECSGGCQRLRPKLQIEIRKTGKSFWKLFERHHYLRGVLPAAVELWTAFLEDKPIAICIVCNMRMHFKSAKRISRLVVLPEFQGIGIGTKLASSVAAWYRRNGYDMFICTAHRSVQISFSRSPDWLFQRKKRAGTVAKYLARIHGETVVKKNVVKQETWSFRFRRGAEKQYSFPEEKQ